MRLMNYSFSILEMANIVVHNEEVIDLHESQALWSERQPNENGDKKTSDLNA